MADSEQPAAAAPAPVYTNVGEVLREARAAKDLTIEQLATELRIEARQLAALEDNRFEQIGPSVFIKGYIRQYGQRLGLDQSTLMDIYNRQTNIRDVQVQPSKSIKLRDERQITVWLVAALVLLLIAVGLAVWWLNGGGFDFASLQRAAQTAPPRAEPTPAAAVAPPAAEPASAAATPSPPPADTPAAATESPPAQTPTAVAPAALAGSPAPAVAPGITPVVATSPAAASPADRISRGAAPISLDVTFNAESWAEITDARGQRLFFDLGTAGRHLVLRGEPPIAITFGNGDAVRLLVDGESFAIPTQGRQGKLVRFSVAGHEG